jgi:hypothetical protein
VNGKATAGANGNRATHRPLAFIGWILYLLSWITPAPESGWFGARAFAATIEYALRFLFHPMTMPGFILGLCLLVGWLANFSILLPLSPRARVAWSIAPWLPFVGALLLTNAPLAVRERIVWQLYFYPWAIGIACVHAAMIVRQRRKQVAGGHV